LTAGKVIIIHPYVYRLYWYLEAYKVTSAIAFCNPGTTGHTRYARVSHSRQWVTRR